MSLKSWAEPEIRDRRSMLENLLEGQESGQASSCWIELVPRKEAAYP